MIDLHKVDQPQEDAYIIYKHSVTCPVSEHAIMQLLDFEEKHPDVPIYKLTVQHDPVLKLEIAKKFGIEHETPQVIIVKKGKAAASLCQYDITVEELEHHFK